VNAARLARRWQEAGEDRVAMAEALVDEIDHPDSALVSRDFLRAELQTLRAELIGTIWRVVLTVFGIQVVLVGAVVAVLVEVLASGGR
jgi:hypothetical protein